MSCWRKDSDECWGTDGDDDGERTVDAPKMTKTNSQVDYYSQDTVDTSHLQHVAAVAARRALTQDGDYLVLALVGLPARGKSFIGAKLRSFLAWRGLECQVFNAGQRRRAASDDSLEKNLRSPHSHAAFFDNANKDAAARRESIAMDTLDSLFDYLESGEGEVGIFDATNSTRQRRKAILDRVKRRFEGTGKACGVVFIETICTDPYVLHSNMLVKVRNSPDFAGLDEATALADLRRRNAHYESAYEPLSDSEGASYITIYNFSSKVTCSLCFGRITRVVLPFLLAIHVDERPIYLVALAPRGISTSGRTTREAEYRKAVAQAEDAEKDLALRLRAWCASAKEPPLHVFCSASIRARAVAGALDVEASYTAALDPFVKEGRRDAHRDLADRLEPVIIDIEGSVAPTLVITHATPARALLAYMHNRPRVRVVDETATTEAPRTLAGADAAVIEVRATVAGGYSETVHLLPGADGSPPPSPALFGRAPSLPWDERRRGSIGFSERGSSRSLE